MSTTTEERREKLAEHREVLEAARDAIFGGPSVDDAFWEVQGSADALGELANVTDVLYGLAVHDELPGGREAVVAADELPYRKVRMIAPMHHKVAFTIFEQNAALRRLHERMHKETCDLQKALQGLVRALAGYGDDVGFPVLEALKELDVDTEEVES